MINGVQGTMSKMGQHDIEPDAVNGEKGAAVEGARAPKFELTTSRQFTSWLAEHKASLAFTTYQAGKLFFLGLKPDGRLSVFNRNLERCMGLAYADGSLYVSTLYQIVRFVDATTPETRGKGADALFTPQLSYITGDLDAHDVAIGEGHRIFFVNTLFSCLAEASATHSFKPYWKPPFIDRLAAEDRCHLNGLAMQAGLPRYVTAVSATNVADGWRDHRRDGGVVLDVQSGETITTGLSMPHSPRLHAGRLWLHNSGTGEFGHVDKASGHFQPLAFCPGYLRGLAFLGDFAILGLSKARQNRTFSGLKLDDKLAQHKVEPRCGLYVVDLRSGDIAHWARIDGIVSELYDVAVIPDRQNPRAVGFKTDEIRRVISIAER